MIDSDTCSVCGGDLLFDVEQDELEVASSPCVCEKMRRPLPWAHLDTVKIRMIESDIMAFGPTILHAGVEYVLPKSIAGEFLANGTATLVQASDKT